MRQIVNLVGEQGFFFHQYRGKNKLEEKISDFFSHNRGKNKLDYFFSREIAKNLNTRVHIRKKYLVNGLKELKKVSKYLKI